MIDGANTEVESLLQNTLDDDLKAGMRLLDGFKAWVKGRTQSSILWTRHGLVPLLFDLPFIKLGKLFVSPDFVMSLQAVLNQSNAFLETILRPGLSEAG